METCQGFGSPKNATSPALESMLKGDSLYCKSQSEVHSPWRSPSNRSRNAMSPIPKSPTSDSLQLMQDEAQARQLTSVKKKLKKAEQGPACIRLNQPSPAAESKLATPLKDRNGDGFTRAVNEMVTFGEEDENVSHHFNSDKSGEEKLECLQPGDTCACQKCVKHTPATESECGPCSQFPLVPKYDKNRPLNTSLMA